MFALYIRFQINRDIAQFRIRDFGSEIGGAVEQWCWWFLCRRRYCKNGYRCGKDVEGKESRNAYCGPWAISLMSLVTRKFLTEAESLIYKPAISHEPLRINDQSCGSFLAPALLINKEGSASVPTHVCIAWRSTVVATKTSTLSSVSRMDQEQEQQRLENQLQQKERTFSTSGQTHDVRELWILLEMH